MPAPGDDSDFLRFPGVQRFLEVPLQSAKPGVVFLETVTL